MEKRFKNPNKENGLKVLVETLKKKNLITDEEIKTTKEQIKLKNKKRKIKELKKNDNKTE